MPISDEDMALATAYTNRVLAKRGAAAAAPASAQDLSLDDIPPSPSPPPAGVLPPAPGETVADRPGFAAALDAVKASGGVPAQAPDAPPAPRAPLEDPAFHAFAESRAKAFEQLAHAQGDAAKARKWADVGNTFREAGDRFAGRQTDQAALQANLDATDRPVKDLFAQQQLAKELGANAMGEATLKGQLAGEQRTADGFDPDSAASKRVQLLAVQYGWAKPSEASQITASMWPMLVQTQNFTEAKRQHDLQFAKGAAHDTALLEREDKRIGLQREELELKRKAAGAGDEDIGAIASAIQDGSMPPDLRAMPKVKARIAAELAKRGFNLAAAQSEWAGTQHHISTLNGPQQERLRQALDFANHSVDQIENLYGEWQKMAPQLGLKTFNRASLEVAKQMGGQAGATAQALEAQIRDLSGELGNVYMGGNSPTDHALKIAGENLNGAWDEPTFKKAVGLLRSNLTLRRNSMLNATQSGGFAGGSRYDAPPPQGASPGAGPAQAGPAAGPTTKVVNGHTYSKLADGRWVEL